MSQKINFEVESAEIVEDPSQSEFATAKLRMFSTGENRHGMYCDEEVLRNTSITAYEKPVIYEIINGDFGTHSDKTVPAGFIVPNSAEFITEEDSRVGFYVYAKIWRRYASKFIDAFVNRNKTSSKLSVEMVLEDTEEREDGLIGMKKFFYTAATILGENVTEASPLANIQMLSFSEKEEYESAYSKEFGFDKYRDLDFRIPDEVKTSAKKAIERHEKTGKGGNSVSLSLAKFLAGNEFITPEKVRLMHKKLSSYSKKELSSDEEQTRFELWGGQLGFNWCKDIFSKLEEIDNKRSSYFANIKKNGLGNPESNFDTTHNVESEWVKKEGKEDKNVKEDEKFEDTKEEEKVETPAEEKAETPAEEKKEKEDDVEMAAFPPKEEGEKEDKPEAKMSLDSYLDMSYMLALMEEQTESRKEFLKDEDEFAMKCAADEIKKEGEKDFAVVSKGMFAKMKEFAGKLAKMEESNRAYMAEFEALKSFKKSVEEAKFSYEVEATLKEVESVMPSEEIEKARVESANFSLESIDAWKNGVKAKAFSFAKPNCKNEKTNVNKPMAWAYDNNVKTKESLWTK